MWWGCYVLCLWHKLTALAHFFKKNYVLVYASILMALATVFHSINSLSVFSLCSSDLISVLLVLSSISLYESLLSPDKIPSGWVGSKHQLSKWLNYIIVLLFLNTGTSPSVLTRFDPYSDKSHCSPLYLIPAFQLMDASNINTEPVNRNRLSQRNTALTSF